MSHTGTVDICFVCVSGPNANDFISKDAAPKGKEKRQMTVEEARKILCFSWTPGMIAEKPLQIHMSGKIPLARDSYSVWHEKPLLSSE